MKVSIFTDASVNSDKSKGGFAFYIGCRLGKIQKAGKIRQSVKMSHIAELICIANALYTLKHSKFEGISKVWIFTDSLFSISMIEMSSVLKSSTQKEVLPILEEIQLLMMEICLKYGKTIRSTKTFFEFKHVKAHTGKKDIYSKINRWCDENAKKYMRLE